MHSVDAKEGFPNVIEADLLVALPEQATEPEKAWEELSRENGVIAYEIYKRAMGAANGDLELFGRIINSQVFLYRSLQAAFARQRSQLAIVSSEPDTAEQQPLETAHQPMSTFEHAA